MGSESPDIPSSQDLLSSHMSSDTKTSRRNLLNSPFRYIKKHLATHEPVDATTPSNAPEMSAFDRLLHVGKMTQRDFVKWLGLGTLAAGGTILEVKVTESAASTIEYFWRAKRVYDFIHAVDSPEILINKSYNHNTPIILPLSEMMRLTFRGIGDSMYDPSGIRINRLRSKQPNSFLDFLRKIPDHFRKTISDWKWNAEDNAIPGATTNDGLGITDPLASADQRLTQIQQLGDTVIQDEMIHDENHEIEFIGFHGDNWRALITTMKQMGERLALLKNQDNITLDDLREIDQLITKHEKITNDFGDGVIKILDEEYFLGQVRNKQRQLQGKKPDQFTFVVTLPLDMSKLSTIPAKALDDPAPGPKVINVHNIPNGAEIFYHIDQAIYTVLADRLPKWHAQHKNVKLYTQSMMGVEKNNMMDKKTGHPNILGQFWLAKQILNRLGVEINGKVHMLRDFLQVACDVTS